MFVEIVTDESLIALHPNNEVSVLPGYHLHNCVQKGSHMVCPSNAVTELNYGRDYAELCMVAMFNVESENIWKNCRFRAVKLQDRFQVFTSCIKSAITALISFIFQNIGLNLYKVFLTQDQNVTVYCPHTGSHATLEAKEGLSQIRVPPRCNMRMASFTLFATPESNGYHAVVKTVSWAEFVLERGRDLIQYNRPDVQEDATFKQYGYLVSFTHIFLKNCTLLIGIPFSTRN